MSMMSSQQELQLLKAELMKGHLETYNGSEEENKEVKAFPGEDSIMSPKTPAPEVEKPKEKTRK